MRSAPFLLALMILAGGVLAAYQSYTSGSEHGEVVVERPTVTPRPRPTSPRQATVTPNSMPALAPSPTLPQSPLAALPSTLPAQPTSRPSPSPGRRQPNSTSAPQRRVSSSGAIPVATATVSAALAALPSPTPPPQTTPSEVQPVGASMDAPTPTVTVETGAGNALPSPTLPALLVVGNTDGMGVFLRRTPKLDDRVRPWRDGTPMVVLGGQQEGDGQLWWHVRAPDGSEGYIPAQYLVAGQ